MVRSLAADSELIRTAEGMSESQRETERRAIAAALARFNAIFQPQAEPSPPSPSRMSPAAVPVPSRTTLAIIAATCDAVFWLITVDCGAGFILRTVRPSGSTTCSISTAR